MTLGRCIAPGLAPKSSKRSGFGIRWFIPVYLDHQLMAIMACYDNGRKSRFVG